jgi:hypothetical protein
MVKSSMGKRFKILYDNLSVFSKIGPRVYWGGKNICREKLLTSFFPLEKIFIKTRAYYWAMGSTRSRVIDL